jgi:hypothetical protein
MAAHIAPIPTSEEIHHKGKRKAQEDWDEEQIKLNRVRTRERAHLILQEANLLVAQ